MSLKPVVVIIIVSTLILFGGMWLVAKTAPTSSVESSSTAKVTTSETTYDWGTVNMENGKVEKIFPIKNDGQDTLKLFNVTTSCACTTAQLVLSDQASPLFGMHTKSSYVLDVLPGQEAELKVIFDPAFHGPNGVGPISRTITVETNDAAQKQLTFTANALVTRE